MTSVVKACEIAPAAYANNESNHVLKEDDLSYDIGNLISIDTHPFSLQNESQLTLHTRDNAQLLLNKIFDLPQQSSDTGLLARLPAATTIIPREKPLPKPKVETRWEAFAKEKGIEKTKKSRMVWDEASQSYAPAWGYKRAGDNLKDWAVEVKAGEDPYADPWTARKDAKASRVDKNIRQMKNNQKNNSGSSIPTGIPVELTGTGNPNSGEKRGKAGTTASLSAAQFATASMGKFDSKRVGEPERVKKSGNRSKRLPVVGNEASESERSLQLLDRVLSSKTKNNNVQQEDGEENPGSKKRRKAIKKITKGQAKKQRK